MRRTVIRPYRRTADGRLLIDVSDLSAAAAENAPVVISAVCHDQTHLLIQRLLRQQFSRRSEQISPDQLQLGLEDLKQSIAEVQAA